MPNIDPNVHTSARQKNTKRFSNVLLVKIYSHIHKGVVARLPDEVSLTLSSEWDSVIAGGTSSGLGFALAEVAGVSTRNEFTSAQTWSGNSPIELTLPLDFYAQENSKNEVIDPIIKLAKMALPRKSNEVKLGEFAASVGLFIPPGPRIFDINSSANDQITIQLGNFVTFHKVIITSVNPVFVTRTLDEFGYPMRARCDVTFRTIFSLTGEELAGMFT